MKKRTITCKEVFGFLCANLDEETNSPRCKALKRHLEGCTNCQATMESLRRTIRLYRAYPNPKIPAGEHKKLLTALEKELPVKKKRRSTSSRY